MDMYNHSYFLVPVYIPVPASTYRLEPIYQMRQQVNAQQVLQHIRTEHSSLFNELQQAGMNRQIAEYVFFFVINFTLNQANTNQSAAQIYQQFQRQVPWLTLLFTQLNVPRNVMNRILTRVIEITLQLLRPEEPADGWAPWENLGGVLTSAPA